MGKVDGGKTTVHRAIPRCREGLMGGGRRGGGGSSRQKRSTLYVAVIFYGLSRITLPRELALLRLQVDSEIFRKKMSA